MTTVSVSQRRKSKQYNAEVNEGKHDSNKNINLCYIIHPLMAPPLTLCRYLCVCFFFLLSRTQVATCAHTRTHTVVMFNLRHITELDQSTSCGGKHSGHSVISKLFSTNYTGMHQLNEKNTKIQKNIFETFLFKIGKLHFECKVVIKERYHQNSYVFKRNFSYGLFLTCLLFCKIQMFLPHSKCIPPMSPVLFCV